MIKFIILFLVSSSVLIGYPLEVDAHYYSNKELNELKANFSNKILNNACVSKKSDIKIKEDKKTITISANNGSCRKDRVLYSKTMKSKVNRILTSDKLGVLNDKFQAYGDEYLKILGNNNLQLTQITYITESEILIIEETYLYGARLLYKTKIGNLKIDRKELMAIVTVSPKGKLISIKFGKIETDKVTYNKGLIDLKKEKNKMDRYMKASYKNLNGVEYDSKFDYIFDKNKLVLNLLVHLKRKDKEKLITIPYKILKDQEIN